MDLAEAEKYQICIIPEQSGISSLVRRNAAEVGLEVPGELVV